MQFPIYLLLFLPLSMSQDVKMVQIHGKVTNASVTNSTIFIRLTECTNECYENPNCSLDCSMDPVGIMINWRKINHYLLKTVRTNISTIPNNTCPASYTNLKFSLTSSTGEKYSWTRTTFGWKFVSCRNGWKRFERDDGTVVCMQRFVYTGNAIPNDTILDCEKHNAVRTGIASIEEYTWMKRVAFTGFGTVIGGERNCPTTPCTSFRWTDGYTTSTTFLNSTYAKIGSFSNSKPFNCLIIRNTNSPAISDDNCHYALIGSFCGYKIL